MSKSHRGLEPAQNACLVLAESASPPDVCFPTGAAAGAVLEGGKVLGNRGKFKSSCMRGMAGRGCGGANQFTAIDFQIKRFSLQFKRCFRLPPARSAASPRHPTNPPWSGLAWMPRGWKGCGGGRDLRGDLGHMHQLGWEGALRSWAMRPRSSVRRGWDPRHACLVYNLL